MKIVINKTLHGIYVNRTMLVPGTNCLDDFDDSTYEAKYFIDNEDIVVQEPSKMTEKEKEKAVENANTTATLDKLQKNFKGVDTSKRRKVLDKFDKDVADASGVSVVD